MIDFIPRIPLLRLLIPFIAGIIFAWCSSISLPLIIFILLILVFISALLFQKKRVRNSINRKSIDGLIIVPTLFFCGWGTCSVNTDNTKNNTNEKKISFLVTLLNDPV